MSLKCGQSVDGLFMSLFAIHHKMSIKNSGKYLWNVRLNANGFTAAFYAKYVFLYVIEYHNSTIHSINFFPGSQMDREPFLP